MSLSPQARRGFTLIELLVVIAIIAILAAILFPVFAKAREKARQTTCLSNQKQIGLAILQYSQDFDELMPQIGGPRTYADGVQYMPWETFVAAYIKNGGGTTSVATSGNVFKCPSNPSTSTAYAGEAGANQYSCDYVCNFNQSFGGPSASYMSGSGAFGNGGDVSIASIVAPASLITLMENTGKGSGSSAWNIDITNSNFSPSAANPGPTVFAGHSGFTNYLFADGHVKALRPFATLSTKDGGTGSSNLWTRNNLDFTDPSDPQPNDIKNARTCLASTAQTYN